MCMANVIYGSCGVYSRTDAFNICSSDSDQYCLGVNDASLYNSVKAPWERAAHLSYNNVQGLGKYGDSNNPMFAAWKTSKW